MSTTSKACKRARKLIRYIALRIAVSCEDKPSANLSRLAELPKPATLVSTERRAAAGDEKAIAALAYFQSMSSREKPASEP
jgi:hypothetical protein